MIKKQLINHKNMLVISLICLGLLLVTTVFPTTQVTSWLGQGKIISDINNYLSESQKFARHDLHKLSELNAQLSLIQSSQVNVPSLDIKVGVGQIMVTLTNLVMESVDSFVLTISTIEIIKLTIKFSEMISPWLFTILLVSGALYGLSNNLMRGNALYKTVCGGFTKITLTIFLVFHLCIPYSLYGAAFFSQQLIVKTKIENSTVLKNLHEDMVATHKKESLKNRTKNVIHTFEKIVLDLPQKVDAMTTYYTQHMAISLFEFILMPILLISLALTTTLWVIRVAQG